MTVVHAYDDPRIVAGAGTAALELLEDVAGLDVLVAPVGGGGMIAGLALVAHALLPGAAVIGVEPAANAPMQRSLAAGRPTAGPVGETIADGQQVAAPGAVNFAIAERLGVRVVTVTEREIAAAVGLLFERTKLVVEPSGATAFAAVLAGKVDVTGRRAGVLLTGGNLDPGRLAAMCP
jgi:threonine dehydratase